MEMEKFNFLFVHEISYTEMSVILINKTKKLVSDFKIKKAKVLGITICSKLPTLNMDYIINNLLASKMSACILKISKNF